MLNRIRRNYRVPNNKEGISAHVIRLNLGVVILQYYFHKSSISAVDDWCLHPRWACEWPRGEIKLVDSLHFVLVRKPYWCCGIDKGNPAKCSSSFPINGYRRLVFQNIHLSHVDRTVFERTLRIWASTTSGHIPPAYACKSKTLHWKILWISEANISQKKNIRGKQTPKSSPIRGQQAKKGIKTHSGYLSLSNLKHSSASCWYFQWYISIYHCLETTKNRNCNGFWISGHA